MSFNDDFFQELLVLGGTIKEIRLGMAENLPEATLLALESANSTLSTRALEILEGIVSDALVARGALRSETKPSPQENQISAITSPSTTVPENTSSMPGPSDLTAVDTETRSEI